MVAVPNLVNYLTYIRITLAVKLKSRKPQKFSPLNVLSYMIT